MGQLRVVTGVDSPTAMQQNTVGIWFSLMDQSHFTYKWAFGTSVETVQIGGSVPRPPFPLPSSSSCVEKSKMLPHCVAVTVTGG